MGGVDLMDQLTYTYHLDRRFKTRFYLHSTHLVDVYNVYGKLIQNELSLIDFQVMSRKAWLVITIIGKETHKYLEQPSLPELELSRGRCHHCKNQGKENRTFDKCVICWVFLCTWWLLHLTEIAFTNFIYRHKW